MKKKQVGKEEIQFREKKNITKVCADSAIVLVKDFNTGKKRTLALH